VWFAVLGDASALGDVVFAAVVAIGTTVGFAAALAAWPSDVEAPGVLVPIFAVYSVLMIGIWVLIRR
jgi:hypothetical protein